MEVTRPAALAEAMVDKLLRDLIAGRPTATFVAPLT